MTPLWAFFNSLLPRRFEWGVLDCCLMPADWVREVTGKDPAGHLRFAYEDRSSCQRVTKFLTDPLDAPTFCMEQVAGRTRVENPVAGDVAVVRTAVDGKIAPVGAVAALDGRGYVIWGLMAPEGVTFRQAGQAQVLRAWGLGYHA